MALLFFNNKIVLLIFLNILKLSLFEISICKELIYRKLKLSSNKEFFNTEILNLMDKINAYETNFNITVFSFQMVKSTTFSSYIRLLLMLAGDVELNPGSTQNISLWTPFKNKGLHFLHLNINSILPKVDELRDIAKNTNAAIIGVTESKIDSSIFDSEINIEGYSLLRKDRNRHGGGVVCYIQNTLCFNTIDIFSEEVENIVFDIFLPKTKPFTVGIFYRPPNQGDFINKISNDFNKLLPLEEIYVLGDININVVINGKSILGKHKNVEFNSTEVSFIGKQYNEFCSTFSLKQLIKFPTRITSISSTLIDHILTNSPQLITQSGVIDTTLSDHQLIFCTRKLSREKFNAHKHIKCRNLKNYSAAILLEELRSSNFLNYDNFENIDKAYSDLSNKLMTAINKVAPMREIRVKNRSQDWFDGEICTAIKLRNRNFKNFKKSKLDTDERIYKDSKYYCRTLIQNKKANFFEKKVTIFEFYGKHEGKKGGKWSWYPQGTTRL